MRCRAGGAWFTETTHIRDLLGWHLLYIENRPTTTEKSINHGHVPTHTTTQLGSRSFRQHATCASVFGSSRHLPFSLEKRTSTSLRMRGGAVMLPYFVTDGKVFSNLFLLILIGVLLFTGCSSSRSFGCIRYFPLPLNRSRNVFSLRIPPLRCLFSFAVVDPYFYYGHIKFYSKRLDTPVVRGS